jgi:hypothetical protein
VMKKQFVEISLFNDSIHAKSVSPYVKWRLVKAKWGVSGSKGEREREKKVKRERERQRETDMELKRKSNTHVL